MRLRWAILTLGLLALIPISGGAAGPAWEQWKTVPGVFDVGGPLSGGSLLVAGSAAYYTLTPAGDLAPFARGAGGYRDDPGAEAYFAVSPGQHVGAAACAFVRDDAFVLRLHVPIGVTRVGKSGDETGSFANLDLPGLNGIAFDTEGLFDHRLLVTGPVNGKSEVVAIDCTGAVTVITRTAPVFEGGLAVAPAGFGSFGGSLIAPDELSGVIWAIAPDGTATQVAKSGLPAGGDIGVESVGFVPKGFARGGELYYADRKTPGNPHPGTVSVLRMSSSDLVAGGVQDGDMLAITEGGASMIDVRCAPTCAVAPIVGTPTTAHGEGHLAFTLNKVGSPSPSARPTVGATPAASKSGSGGVPIAVLIVVAVVAAAAGAGVAVALARRR